MVACHWQAADLAAWLHVDDFPAIKALGLWREQAM
jgi:hypothetical protein